MSRFHFGYPDIQKLIIAGSGDVDSLLFGGAAIAPDLLITDVFMPSMSGIDLAIAMRTALPIAKCCYFPDTQRP